MGEYSEENIMNRKRVTETQLEAISSSLQSMQLTKGKEDLIQSVKSPKSIEDYKNGVKFFRKKLCDGDSDSIKEVITLGLVPYLVEALKQDQYLELQLDAAWALTNICAGNNEQTTEVVSEGALPILIDMLNQNDDLIVEQAIWAIGNIAAEDEFRKILIEKNALKLILKILENENYHDYNGCEEEDDDEDDDGDTNGFSFVNGKREQHDNVIRIGTWALANFCRDNNRVIEKESILLDKMAKIICKFYSTEDKESLKDIVWCSNLFTSVEWHYTNKLLLSEHGIFKKISRILRDKTKKEFYSHVLKTLAHLLSGPSSLQDEFLKSELPLINRFVILLNKEESSSELISRILWVIENLATNMWSKVKLILNENILQTIISFIHYGSNEVKNTAANVLMSIIHCHGIDQRGMTYLIENNAMLALGEVLTWSTEEDVECALHSLHKVFKLGKAKQYYLNHSLGERYEWYEVNSMKKEKKRIRIKHEKMNERNNILAFEFSKSNYFITLRLLISNKNKKISELAKDVYETYFIHEMHTSNLMRSHLAMTMDELEKIKFSPSDSVSNGTDELCDDMIIKANITNQEID